MLDNFPHIKSFWIMNSAPVTQSALWYGADDVDGTIMEYEIIRDPSKDRKQVLTSRDLVEMIIEAGRDPIERDPFYNVVSVGLDNVQDVEEMLSQQYADAGHNAENLDIMRRQEVVTAAQSQIGKHKLTTSPEMTDEEKIVSLTGVCPQCGHENDRSWVLCDHCGARLPWAPPASQRKKISELSTEELNAVFAPPREASRWSFL